MIRPKCEAIPHHIERLVMSLKSKVAIVTGGNSGIGQAIVHELAHQEASIVIDYLVRPEATENPAKGDTSARRVY